ncbi:Uncharacterised protein [Niallia circulans]|jgi:predicted SAM-dependent methyltransferase|nr:Uncharacterised protein [Niallia circulans]
MKDETIKIGIGAGEYRNNPGWIHTQEDELNLLWTIQLGYSL